MYKKFSKINGTHPWRDVSPEGYVNYPACYRKGGRVLHFNFSLARELGLIPKHHPDKMNDTLEKVILKTFSIQILNEHDWMHRKDFPRDGYEEHLYMATRYLQVQHEDKRGGTSGDGRAIWNGTIKCGKKVFDVSSRGTGATRLSPGAQEAEGAIKTGDDSLGYASGLADLEEMMASAIMSEIFYRHNFPTERTLVVIDYKNNTSIGVRTSPNLIRPAHLFRYLKMGMYKELKDSFDYFIERQESNGYWKLPAKGARRYTTVLGYLCKTYARLAALMEEEYIFNWLAWDGDNILASGAMLDYGSIRRFAAKHNKYRYEDVDRFSTSLTEQRREARYLVQTFAQLIDFIITEDKRNIKDFSNDLSLQVFDETFKVDRQRRMLFNMGFTYDQVDVLIKDHIVNVEKFQQVLNHFEEVKTVAGEKNVPDGIDHPPIFLVRNILRELPQFLMEHKDEGAWPMMPAEMFCDIMAASYANKRDLEITLARADRVFLFQQLYQDLIFVLSRKHWVTLKNLTQRATVINHEHRTTGDGLTWIVTESLKSKDTFDRAQFQEAIDRFIESQVLMPEQWDPIREEELKGNTTKARLLKVVQANLEYFKEKI
ncbi:MAG: hypothetical protein ACI9F2_000892 [Lysobacterales bacterium]|jgi:hypothetical protein